MYHKLKISKNLKQVFLYRSSSKKVPDNIISAYKMESDYLSLNIGFDDINIEHYDIDNVIKVLQEYKKNFVKK